MSSPSSSGSASTHHKQIHNLTFGNKVLRGLWAATYLIMFRPTPRILYGWRRFILRIFGARIGRGAIVYPSTRIWAPWNLEMGERSCLAFDVDCYCVAKVRIGDHAIVSQYSYLCTASHDHTSADMPLIAAPITIGNRAWVTAESFVGPGVTVGEGAIVGAKSAVFKDVAPWTIVGGCPAKFIKQRPPIESP